VANCPGGSDVGLTRRDFVVGSGVAAVGAVALSTVGCSDEPNEGAGSDEDAESLPGVIVDSDVPPEATIFGWVTEIFDQGVRRPGYPADEWAEGFLADELRRLGLENVRLEPVALTRWEPVTWSLQVMVDGGEPVDLGCFPVPYGPPVDGLEVELAKFDADDPGRVEGKASLYSMALLEVPADSFMAGGSAPADLSRRSYDPDGTLGEPHRVPTGAELGYVLAPSVEAGALAFIGSLKNYPGNAYEFFTGYPVETGPVPGVWISGTDGEWLDQQLAEGTVTLRLSIDSSSGPFESHNVVGELPGADDEVVMIGSHHDGPWSSAVEDGSGMALVLAQATYWAERPVEDRPHRLVFLLHAGHMAGGAGHGAYIEAHRDELDGVVLQVHLEHAALECDEDEDGSVVPTGRPVPRWFFTSRIPELEATVFEALEAEDLRRSMLLAPDAIGEQPSTDGAYYYHEGVPIVHFLAAPFYLFDSMDTPDKVDRENLVPLTRATIRIIESTARVSAADMRAADLRDVKS
jgi:hypothetical protein